jgi:hypothetical protein
VITDVNSDCSDPISNSVSVLVVEDATVSVSVNNAEVCIGGDATLTADVTGGSSAFTYQWESSSDNISFVPIAGATDGTYSAPTTVAGETWYHVVITDPNSDCSDPVSNSVSVLVVEDATVDVSVNNAEVCIDGDATLTADVTGGSSAFTYQWESSSDNISFVPIAGATDGTYSAPTTVAGETWYHVVITDVNSDCSDPTSNSVSVLVVEDATVSVSVNNAEVCIGGDATLTAAVTGGSSAFTYQWESSGDNISFVPVAGATDGTYSAPTATANLTYYRVVITDVNSDCSDPISNSVSVLVVEDATVDVSVNNAEVCIDGDATLTAAVTGGSSAFTYQWQSSTNDVLFTDIGGATAGTYSAPTTAAGVLYYRVVITDPNSDCSDPVSNSVSVTVVEDAAVVVSVNNAEVCIDGTATLTAAVSGGSSLLAYQWQSSGDDVIFTNIPGATASTYAAPTTIADLTYYRVVITDVNSGCSEPTSNSVSVLVVEDATVDVSVNNAEVCIDGDATLTADVTGGSSAFTYQWQSSEDDIDFNNIAGATDGTYSAPTAAAGLTWYRVVITDVNSGCSDPTSNSVSVLVVEDATVSVSVNNAEVCIGGDATLTAAVSGGSSAFTYQWQSSSDNISFVPIAGATDGTTGSRGCDGECECKQCGGVY